MIQGAQTLLTNNSIHHFLCCLCKEGGVNILLNIEYSYNGKLVDFFKCIFPSKLQCSSQCPKEEIKANWPTYSHKVLISVGRVLSTDQ